MCLKKVSLESIDKFDLKYSNMEPLLHTESGLEHKKTEGKFYAFHW
jgi:hypothetical protein